MKLGISFCVSVFFFVCAFKAYAGGNYLSVSLDKKIDLSSDRTISMVIENGADPVLKECKKISVYINETGGFLVWTKSIFNITDKDVEKTGEAVALLNKKIAKSEKALFGYIGGGLKPSADNKCTFTSQRLEIDSSIENVEPVVFAFN